MSNFILNGNRLTNSNTFNCIIIVYTYFIVYILPLLLKLCYYVEDVLKDDKGECVICLEELTQGDTIARLPCLCIYHKT